MADKRQTIRTAIQTLSLEAEAIKNLCEKIDEQFEKIVELIFESKGRVVVTGIGKSAIIAQKIVATLNSTGTPSTFMHAADAVHGDLGMIQRDDIIICISKSGDTPEIKVLTPLLKKTGNVLIGMTGNLQSYLAKQADFVMDTTVEKEACPNNLAPTTSTTAQLAMGDALAVCLLEKRSFKKEDFARYHPGGALGKRLYLLVADLLAQHEVPAVNTNDDLKSIILEITSKRLGATAVLTENKELEGIITDGDLRRMLEKGINPVGIKALDIMSRNPKRIDCSALAVDALELMRQFSINQLIVTDSGKYAGIIHLQDLVKEGII